MLMNMNLPSKPFVFSYTGEFSDNRVNGSGSIRLLSDGILTISTCSSPFAAYIIGGGGGGANIVASPEITGASLVSYRCCGGGGGKMLIQLMPEPGDYNIVIGKGGKKSYVFGVKGTATAEDGGSTSAFGYTCTGGMGGIATNTGETVRDTLGGSPNGEAPTFAKGGAPNGGDASYTIDEAGSLTYFANDGGSGYVDLIFA